MKTYIKPVVNVINMQSLNMLADSKRVGVRPGNVVGKDYKSTDISYGKKQSDWDDWDDWDE